MRAWLGLALAMGLGTAAMGWLAVPVLALGWGALTRRRRHADWLAALAAAVAWSGLLVWGALTGSPAELARRAGALLGIPAWGFVAATLLFGALLALAGAALTRRFP